MYLINLHNITGILPEIMNKYKAIHSFSNRKKIALHKKGSRLSIAAFLLLSVSLLNLGCESSGSVGDGLVSDDDSIDRVEYSVENLETVDINSFSGRLQNSSLGYIEDPLFGTLNAVFLAKPSINAAPDSIREDDSLSLRVIFNSTVYGDDSSVSSYEIFEVDEIWRGNQLRHNREIAVNFSEKVGEFQVSDEDTLVVPLSEEWTEKFAEFYNSEEANRDSLYINNFPGLAIVPSQNNSKIRFLKNQPDSDDEQALTSFLLNYTSSSSDDEDEIGEETDDEEFEIGVRDWGSSVIRTGEPEPEDGFVLHNAERVLKVDIDLPQEELISKNIVNVRLLLSVDRLFQSSIPLGRTIPETIRANVFLTEPTDLAGEIFTRDPAFLAVLDNSGEFYSINITQYVLNDVFGELEQGSIYLSLESVNGFLYSSKFFGNDGPENRKPKIVITSAQ